MTGLEMILAALAAGAGTGAGDAARAAVVDTYTDLRNALRRRLASRESARQVLDAGSDDAGVWNADLATELAESDVADDEAIVEAAQRLLALVDPIGAAAGKYHVDARQAKGVQVGDYNTQHNSFG
jgi:hypothetical protein